MKIAAFVPAKGTSDRVANKNTRTFNGEPFFAFTLRKLLRIPEIDEVYIDSEDPAILEIGARLGATPLLRDPALASNATDGNALFMAEVEKIEADIYIQHLCTSPFVRAETISESIRILREKPEFDSVTLGRQEKCYFWSGNTPSYPIEAIPNSVDLPDTRTEAMALYAIRSEAANRLQRRVGDHPFFLTGSPLEVIDVNTEEEFSLASTVAEGLLAQSARQHKALALLLSSPTLSDILDECGHGFVLPPEFRPNFPAAKFLGRARTLHIREAIKEDQPDAIYRALDSYETITQGDVIVVQNDRPDLAYFGELNMSLAIRSGAVGALIGGLTRDTVATSAAMFPIYSTGDYCRDIKGKGAVASINQPIEIAGFPINPSDLIFADRDGVVIIPSEHIGEVIPRALEVVGSERNILSDVAGSVEVGDLVSRHGFF